MRVWIDTDLGSDVDDALALAHALRHPEIELVGVSTVFGDVALRTRLVQALLDAAGEADVPVCTGLGKPLSASRPGVMFGHEGRGVFEDAAPVLQITEAEPDAGARIDALAERLDAARPDVAVCIGPLTNLGALAERGVALPRLAIMGGKVEDVMLPGMIPAIEEWNWHCDPRAVQATLTAPHEVPPRVVPAEVTFRTALAKGDVERLAEGDALARALSELCGVWLEALRQHFKVPEPRVALHDPLTIATLVEDGLCRFAQVELQVDDEGRTTRGAGAPAEVATDVDVEKTRLHLMETWMGGTG